MCTGRVCTELQTGHWYDGRLYGYVRIYAIEKISKWIECMCLNISSVCSVYCVYATSAIKAIGEPFQILPVFFFNSVSARAASLHKCPDG